MRVLGIGFASLLLATSIFAQAVPSSPDQPGSIAGIVKDPSGVPVEAASIQVHSAETAGTFKAVSDKNGAYRLTGIPAGTYDLQANGPALKALDQKAIKVAPGKALNLDLTLEFNTQLGTLGEDRFTQAADAARHHPPSGP